MMQNEKQWYAIDLFTDTAAILNIIIIILSQEI